jgi:hypothetical protein
MIKFFRHIRKRLIGEKRFSKYLLYAIGEIILVVIGILIALQINNWNEDRLTSEFELQMLTSLKEGLTTDLADIDFNIKYTTRGIAKTDTIIKYLRTEQPRDLDTIARWFSDAMTPTRFQYSTSAFETLKSKGITLISNDVLRKKIIDVYDAEYNFFLAQQEMHLLEIERGYTTVLATRFEDSYNYDTQSPGFPGSLRPLNFLALKYDQEFLYFFKSLKNRSLLLISFHYRKLRAKVVELIANIDDETIKKTKDD